VGLVLAVQQLQQQSLVYRCERRHRRAAASERLLVLLHVADAALTAHNAAADTDYHNAAAQQHSGHRLRWALTGPRYYLIS